jgi:hypothetical protein
MSCVKPLHGSWSPPKAGDCMTGRDSASWVLVVVLCWLGSAGSAKGHIFGRMGEGVVGIRDGLAFSLRGPRAPVALSSPIARIASQDIAIISCRTFLCVSLPLSPRPHRTMPVSRISIRTVPGHG